ncbi:MAG: GAF domain-containing sensor histidine kinase [Nitriliruptorales bacterium]|nr:GAF domain-containing sensor histidine kinase [Nitriliruptorales bacterium]
MTGSTHALHRQLAALPARTVTFVRNLPRRLGERAFWVTQAGVIGITVIHVVAELWLDETHVSLPTAFHHVPAVLYLVPIGYASFRYGSEGAILTGIWSAALTLPNLLLWHRTDFEWLSELVYIAIVISVGVVMAIPVEQERRQRQRAEATNRRLALLDDIATLTLTAELQETLDTSLRRLVALLDVDAACVALWADDRNSSGAEVIACERPGSVTAGSLFSGVGSLSSMADLEHATEIDEGVTAVPLAADLPGSGSAGRVEGVLAIQRGGRTLYADDHRLLAGVASHLAIAMASAQLQASERDRLRSYAQLVTRAQEEERKRIARELHDEGAQNLVAVRRELDRLADASTDAPVAQDLRRLHEVAGETLAGLRRFSKDLRPPTLDDLGLTSALDTLVVEFEQRTEASCQLRVEGHQHRLTPETELVLFRIGQAALHNVEQHAEARQVSVDVTFDRDRTRLCIADDGCGFEPPERPDELTRLGKLGLAGMHERAILVGGELTIDSAPGGGTRVLVEVPHAPRDDMS